MVFGAPPLIRLFLIGETFFEELEEAPLGPFVVFWVGSVDFARPVDGVAKPFGLFTEIGDILLGDFLWGGVGLDGVVLGGEAKSIVAERSKDIESLLGIETSEHINNSEVADMADVKTGARRVGEHFGEHHFGLAFFFGGLEGFGVLPDFLPFLFYFEWFVSIHNGTII